MPQDIATPDNSESFDAGYFLFGLKRSENLFVCKCLYYKGLAESLTLAQLTFLISGK